MVGRIDGSAQRRGPLCSWDPYQEKPPRSMMSPPQQGRIGPQQRRIQQKIYRLLGEARDGGRDQELRRCVQQLVSTTPLKDKPHRFKDRHLLQGKWYLHTNLTPFLQQGQQSLSQATLTHWPPSSPQVQVQPVGKQYWFDWTWAQGDACWQGREITLLNVVERSSRGTLHTAWPMTEGAWLQFDCLAKVRWRRFDQWTWQSHQASLSTPPKAPQVILARVHPQGPWMATAMRPSYGVSMDGRPSPTPWQCSWPWQPDLEALCEQQTMPAMQKALMMKGLQLYQRVQTTLGILPTQLESGFTSQVVLVDENMLITRHNPHHIHILLRIHEDNGEQAHVVQDWT